MLFPIAVNIVAIIALLAPVVAYMTTLGPVATAVTIFPAFKGTTAAWMLIPLFMMGASTLIGIGKNLLIARLTTNQGQRLFLFFEALGDNMKRRETYFEKNEMENLLIAAGYKIEKSYIYGDALGRSATKWVYVFARK